MKNKKAKFLYECKVLGVIEDAGSLQSGGGNVDLSYSSLKQVAGDLHAVAFQVAQENATITAVNQSFLHGNEKMRKEAMDIYNFDKKVVYDQMENWKLMI